MTTGHSPPYRAAAIAAAAVLLVYLFTLAPSVTFWDAGELIAAARVLGIPHPPGTPLWILIGHVWGIIVPMGDYAWRLNLLSAVGGAIAAGCWFLVVHHSVHRMHPDRPDWLAHAAGAAAAVLAAFSFTTWQNHVEAEVYSVAMITMAAAAWCATRWRELRNSRRGNRLLLLLLYFGAISIGNHLLALLVGPALVMLLVSESWRDPLLDVTLRNAERARIAMVSAVWLLLIALGLGNTTLILIGGALVLAASAIAFTRSQLGFAITAVLIVLIGISPYLFLYLRAGQGPFINEADPSTWESLLAVIRRAQYPIRTPLDDPTILHGPLNPGRTLTILGYQLANYIQYFDWQWARGLGDGAISTPLRAAATGGAAVLGVMGARSQWRGDRSGFWLVGTLFLVTGLGLVLYMNFKPGPSIGWGLWQTLADHEVRERDYFFVASFVAWGLWMAIGLGSLTIAAIDRFPAGRRFAPLVFLLALIPMAANGRDASRRHGADATMARDFSRALLNSVPPGGILFTWGDNDTFPLWHAQLVDGIRTDVTIVCLALAETAWYQRQLRDNPVISARDVELPALWNGAPIPEFTGPVHSLTDEEIARYRPQLADRDYELPLPGENRLSVPARSELYAKDMLLLAVVRQNAGKRPISWAVTTAHKTWGARLIQQGLVLTLPLDSSRIESSSPLEPTLDIEITTRLMNEQWHFGQLLEQGVEDLDPNIAAMARTLALPYTRLGITLADSGDNAGALNALRIANRLAPDQPGMAEFISQLDSEVAIP